MDEGKLRVTLDCESQFGDGLVVFFAVEVRFAHQEVKLGRVLADLDQVAQRPLLQVRAPRLVGRDAQHIKIIQLAGSLRPERLQRGCCFAIALD